MTCLVGIDQNEDGISVVGSDTKVSGWDDTFTLRNSKTFERTTSCEKSVPIIMSVAGNIRISQLLQYKFFVPGYYSGDDGNNWRERNLEWLATDFVDAFKALLVDNNVARNEDNLIEHDSQILVLFNGVTYTVCSNFQIDCFATGFMAIGSGESFAYGSLESTVGQDIVWRAAKALEVAGKFSQSVGPPYNIKVYKHGKKIQDFTTDSAGTIPVIEYIGV